MINKEQFIRHMNKIQNVSEEISSTNKLIKDNKLIELHIFNGVHEETAIEILRDMFQDYGDSWLDYYIYELDFGKDWKVGCITDVDGTDIPLSNASELYDMLIENMKGDNIDGDLG